MMCVPLQCSVILIKKRVRNYQTSIHLLSTVVQQRPVCLWSFGGGASDHGARVSSFRITSEATGILVERWIIILHLVFW